MDIIIAFPLLLALLGGHAVADYGLQSAYMAEFKVRRADNPTWYVTLAAHCLIHAFMVLVICGAAIMAKQILGGADVRQAAMLACAGATALGWLEFGLHFAIDDAKGQARFSYATDQALHYGCKLAWGAIIAIAY